MFVEIELSEYEYEQFQKEYKTFNKTKDKIYISKILNRIDKAYLYKTKTERNDEIYKCRKSGMLYSDISTKFNLSVDRIRQICKIEDQRKNYAKKILDNAQKSNCPSFYACLEKACDELGMESASATRAYNFLVRNGVISNLERYGIDLDFYNDENLMGFRGFGTSTLTLCRRANEIYKIEKNI